MGRMGSLAGRLALGICIVLSSIGRVHAGMTLTPAAQAAGFGLSTFASGFPSLATSSGNLGPLGVVFPNSGGVLVSDLDGSVRRFATDADGQSAGNAPVAQNYGLGNAFDMRSIGGAVYMVQKGTGAVVQLNDDGTLRQTIVTGLNQPEGLAPNPANGHLLVSNGTFGQIYDVDPIAKTVNVLLNQGFDGIVVSPDGKTLYGASQDTSHVLGYALSTRSLVFDSGAIGGLDGIAIGFGSLAGNLFVNTNSGNLVEVNLATLVKTTIASGGSRGDFVAVDPTNGSLLLTQSDTISRITAPPGGSFTTPEPSSIILLAIGGFGVAIVAHGRRSRPV